MADDSELDYLRTFLACVHTAATVKHLFETGKSTNTADTQKMLVYPPELIGSDGDDFYWKRYLIKITEISEANLSTALNNIFIGIKKFNKRTAITSFTRPATMCHIRFANANRSHFTKKSAAAGIWSQDIWLDVEWSTS